MFNNSNRRLEHLTRAGLSAYAVFNCTCFQGSVRTTHTRTRISGGTGTEETVFEKRKVFKEELKELTGRMKDRNRELVPDRRSLVREVKRVMQNCWAWLYVGVADCLLASPRTGNELSWTLCVMQPANPL